MSSPLISFGICSLTDIESTATSLAFTILGNKKTMDAVIESLHATAVTRIEYARSVAILARQIEETLGSVDIDAADDFHQKLVDAAISTYFNFWSECFGHVPEGSTESRWLEYVDPIAVSGFMGDLLSLKLICFDTFEWCLFHLVKGISSKLHLRCLHALFAHGFASHRTETSSKALMDCINNVRSRCTETLGFFTVEEHEVRELLFDISFCLPDRVYPNVVDQHLDLEEALMASVCCPINIDWSFQAEVYFNALSSPCAAASIVSLRVPSPVSSASSVESEVVLDFAKHMKAPAIERPQHQTGESSLPGNDGILSLVS